MYLYGASGHAKVIMDILRANNIQVKGLVDDDTKLTELSGLPVCHDATGLSPMIVSIGDCKLRRMVVERLCHENTEKPVFPVVAHPSAIISPTATIGEGSVVMQGAIIQTEAKIGKHCIINTRASIDHECMIEDYVHVAPGCTFSGNVHVGSGSWIGIGTTIIQGVKIGKNCFIGAGSVVTTDIPDGCKAYGVPCKIIDK
ncbi:MAG: acetyltransferase [Bacteroidales bacterium]|nr:acetyltransferase [Bacteroidales bacterium]